MQARTVYITCPDLESARTIARAIVKERLAACANIVENMHSIYWWQEELVEDQEVVLLFKTLEKHMDALMDLAKQLHPYEVPCIVAWPIREANPDYIQWIVTETTKEN